mgnify:CR=1 FL=1
MDKIVYTQEKMDAVKTQVQKLKRIQVITISGDIQNLYMLSVYLKMNIQNLIHQEITKHLQNIQKIKFIIN